MTDAVVAPFPEAVQARLAQGAFLLIDKPRGPSSHQVTAWVRDLLALEKAGHAGTLDPNVSGLLWVGVGPALKLLPLLLEFPKRYVGLAAFHGPVEPKELARVVKEFTGPIFQTPPVRSAVRRERRIRTIHRLELLERTRSLALFDVVADSGTYVRTLAADLGDALGVGGHLAELRRVGTGPFREEAAVTLAVVSDAVARAREGQPDDLLRLLHPIDEVWHEFPTLILKEGAAAAVAHGAGLARGGIASVNRAFAKGALVSLVSRKGELIAVGRALVDSDEIAHRKEGWVVQAERVLVDPSRFPAVWRDATSPAGGGPAAA